MKTKWGDFGLGLFDKCPRLVKRYAKLMRIGNKTAALMLSKFSDRDLRAMGWMLLRYHTKKEI